MFGHNISAMVTDLTILMSLIAFKLVSSKLTSLSLATSKFPETCLPVYHNLLKSNLCLMKFKSKFYLVKIISSQVTTLQKYSSNIIKQKKIYNNIIILKFLYKKGKRGSFQGRSLEKTVDVLSSSPW